MQIRRIDFPELCKRRAIFFLCRAFLYNFVTTNISKTSEISIILSCLFDTNSWNRFFRIMQEMRDILTCDFHNFIMISISIEDDQRTRKSHGAYLHRDSCERATCIASSLARVCVSQEIRARSVRFISRSRREHLERSGVSFGTSLSRKETRKTRCKETKQARGSVARTTG